MWRQHYDHQHHEKQLYIICSRTASFSLNWCDWKSLWNETGPTWEILRLKRRLFALWETCKAGCADLGSPGFASFSNLSLAIQSIAHQIIAILNYGHSNISTQSIASQFCHSKHCYLKHCYSNIVIQSVAIQSIAIQAVALYQSGFFQRQYGPPHLGRGAK